MNVADTVCFTGLFKLFTRLTLLRGPKPQAPQDSVIITGIKHLPNVSCMQADHSVNSRNTLHVSDLFQSMSSSQQRSQGGPILLNVLINTLGSMKGAVHCARPCIRQFVHILSFNARAVPGS